MKKDYHRKVKLKALAPSEREPGTLIEFGDAKYYTVVRVDEQFAYLLRVGPLE